ncbi:coiled-coil domain-containing protein 58 [Ditylenchus destructor]|uniref:Protein MIX23 n=1 Tax=Ditylenchus destructor TaxID=166010 RepID=A0AAD4MVZ2_9BILA|nr:coiled-coil domain-containing protein 58 [Ditylenchus destructor]
MERISSIKMSLPVVDCRDLVDFQRLLNKLRQNEDKILFKLNCDLPTKSFQKNKKHVQTVCEDIQNKLANSRKQRSDLIYNCVRENQQTVNQPLDERTRADLRIAHNNLRLLKSEYDVEEVIAAQTDKVVHERCRKEAI